MSVITTIGHIAVAAAGGVTWAAMRGRDSVPAVTARRAAAALAVLAVIRIIAGGGSPPPIPSQLAVIVIMAVIAASVASARMAGADRVRGARMRDHGAVDRVVAKIARYIVNRIAGRIGGAIPLSLPHVVQPESRWAWGGVPIPMAVETRSIAIVGSPGTGKSQAITIALDALRDGGARSSIIADPSGVYTARYYCADSGDVIINPFDVRSAKWSPLAEIRHISDCPAMAKSIVPDAEGEAREWNRYAQVLLQELLSYCFSRRLNNGDLYRLIIADNDSLKNILANTPVTPLLSDGNEKMLASVRSIIGSYTDFLRYLPANIGADGYSVRDHIANQRPGWIFLPYSPAQKDALKSMICAIIDVASRAVLGLAPDLNRRIVFALDELPLLGKVQSITELLTNGRKYGVVALVGIQTIAQLRETYGRYGAQVLMACLGNALIFRCADYETADYFAHQIGDVEKRRYINNINISKDIGHGAQEQYDKTQLVLPSEIQNLKDLNAYLIIANSDAVQKIKIGLADQRPPVAEAFVPVMPVMPVTTSPINTVNDGDDGGSNNGGSGNNDGNDNIDGSNNSNNDDNADGGSAIDNSIDNDDIPAAGNPLSPV